ncbi:hypothetical protein SH139x_003926 [Planctomycetaceae bacterium SH139]
MNGTPNSLPKSLPNSLQTSGPHAGDLQALITRLVRDALRAASSAGTGNADNEKDSPSSVSTEAARSQAANQLTASLPERVISLRELENLPAETKQVRVATAAVITPAAADELRRRGIAIERGAVASVANQSIKVENATSGQPSAEETSLWGYISDADGTSRATAVAKQLTLRGLPVSVADSQQLPSLLVAGALGILLSPLPAVDVDRWGRELGMVTAAVDSPQHVLRIAAAMAPQVWVLDTERLTLSAIVAVAAVCLRTGRGQSGLSGGQPA